MLAHAGKEAHLYTQGHVGINVQWNKGKGIDVHIRFHIDVHIYMQKDVDALNSS